QRALLFLGQRLALGLGHSGCPSAQAGRSRSDDCTSSLRSGAAREPVRWGRVRVSARIAPMAVPASFANRRTMPTVVRLSKIASRIACSSTAATWMLSFTPWWNSIVNSVSPSSRAMAAVELKAPAARAERDTVSSDREAPPRARSCPLRSMRSASIAPDSPRKWRRTPLIRCASSSWMAILSFRLIECPLFLSESGDEDHAGYGVERVEHTLPLDRDRLEIRD